MSETNETKQSVEIARMSRTIGELLQSVSARTSERDQARLVIAMLEDAHVEDVNALTAESARVRELEQELARLKSIRFDPTNHHNAATCPYCTKVSRQERDALRAALVEALDEWAYNAGYKGEHLRSKHADLDRISELRTLAAQPQEHP